MGITLRMYAQRKGWSLRGTQLTLTPEKSGHGILTKIETEIQVEGDLSDEQRSRLKEIAARCPTHKALTAGIAIVEVQAER